MSFTVTQILTMAQRFLVDIDDDGYRDTTTHQPMLDYYNEAVRRFAAETHCCQGRVDIAVTAQSITFAALTSALVSAGYSASQVLYIVKLLPQTGINYTPLPKAPMSEMRALLVSATTAPERYSVFAESIYFDTHPDTTLSFTATISCSFIPTDASDVTTATLIPDEWVQAIVKYIVFCCRVTDRDSGLANGAYQEFEAIKQAAANVFISQIEKIPGSCLMSYPVPQPVEVNYQSEEFEKLIVSDFTGGLNITDPTVTLPSNQFTTLSNYYYNRQGTLVSRPPYRPAVFSTSVQDKYIVVDLDWEGDMYQLKTLHDYQVFTETLSNGWSYNDEVHVVSGIFEDVVGSGDDLMIIAVYNSSDDLWTAIWIAANTSTTAISVVPYKINQAFDLIIFPNNVNPERWEPSSTTSGGTNDHIVGDLSDLGLTAPIAASAFDASGVVSDSAEGLDSIAAGTVYYKFSYFYDDANGSTKYGESSTTAVTTGTCTSGIALGAAAGTEKSKITISFTNIVTPATVSKVRIYRAPDASVLGPYKYIGEVDVTQASPDTIPDYIDTTPWGEEGIEDLQAGSNPSLSGSDLSVLNARTVGAHIIGFDASMKHKLIWSDSGTPDVWNPLNFDYLDNDGIRAIEFNRSIYAYTTSSCFQKTAIDATATKISNIGCADGRTLQDVGSGLMWLDYDTCYFANYVQQYGSKGDFPLNIGHSLSKSIKRRDTTVLTNSAFFERRYYLTYTDTEDYISRTYIYDIDIKSWTQHSSPHLAWARGLKTLFSLGVGNSRYYVYEHDYSSTVSIVTGRSEYAGKDYHDYNNVIQPIARWTMDDDAADRVVVNSINTDDNGELDVATTSADLNTTGQIDDALDFSKDSGSHYAVVGDDAKFSFAGDVPFSLSAIVDVQAGAADRVILAKALSDAGVGEWRLSLNATEQFYFMCIDNGTAAIIRTYSSIIAADDYGLHTVTVTYDGSGSELGLNMYVDGILDNATRNMAGSYVGMDAGALDVTIGCQSDFSGLFNGIIDEVMIYDRELTAGDAAGIANEENTFYGEMNTISSSIGRLNNKLAGDYRKAFISSLTLEVEGSVVDIDAIISGQGEAFSTTKNFSDGSNEEQVTAYAAIYDESVYAADPVTTDAADADEAGYAGNIGADTFAFHKKINRVIKSNAIGIVLTSVDSRGLSILYIVVYWKPLPTVA